jgi:nucleoid-associated protein Lsr2
MAQKVLVENLDDIDGTEAEHVGVEFSLDGVIYNIDLSDANKQALEEVLAPYIDAGRRTGGRLKRGTSASAKSARVTSGVAPTTNGRSPGSVDPAQTQAIRDWANRNGYEVKPRGRIAAHVVEAFEEAMGPDRQPGQATTKPAGVAFQSPTRAAAARKTAGRR